jgi:hypothetical protein
MAVGVVFVGRRVEELFVLNTMEVEADVNGFRKADILALYS